MKNPSVQFTIILLFSTILISPSIIAQMPPELPDGNSLSFNGKFISSHPNTINSSYSENGEFYAMYAIKSVSDENRDITDFKLFNGDHLMYSLEHIPGSDIMISNSGFAAIFDMSRIYKNQVTVHIFTNRGTLFLSRTYHYTSLFGFSPSGDLFVAGTDKKLVIRDLKAPQEWEVASCSKFAFSANEKILVTAREDILRVYYDFSMSKEISTGLFYPRALAVNSEADIIAIVGKSKMNVYHARDFQQTYTVKSPADCSFRDVRIHKGKVLAGVHKKKDGVSEGILLSYTLDGQLLTNAVMASKQFKTFPDRKAPVKSTTTYDPIPWPFEPFDEVHKVWNHYEQHMGNGSGDWSYLHQGLDIEVPIDEPTYAVEAGWVKLVLTLGGDAYWRVAVSPVQSSGYSDGWLYAHLVQSSIQVDVGDYVEVHDYIGDIIYWSSDWGHIHFVNIHDQGDIWYYDDDEWGINFNPLLALDPNTDDYAPVIEEFSSSSKFGFCENESSIYLDPNELNGEVDIIAKISDYHGSSDWEQPAYRSFYWFKKHPEGTIVFPKTLGQILNHSYEMYNGGYYEAYASLLYKKDYLHPSPPWMEYNRDYYQILTNNNGDSIAEPWETELAFNTAEYYDGSYLLFIEVWDEYGNMAIDSQLVEFMNNNVSGIDPADNDKRCVIFPNPAIDKVFIQPGKSAIESISVLNTNMQCILHFNSENVNVNGEFILLNLSTLDTGVYFVLLEGKNDRILRKIIKK